MRWYFLWGPFRGGIFFGVRSEGIFLCLFNIKVKFTLLTKYNTGDKVSNASKNFIAVLQIRLNRRGKSTGMYGQILVKFSNIKLTDGPLAMP
jgi:hypothetical protein